MMNHIETLTKQYDSSFYLYDLDAFENHIQAIRDSLQPGIKIWYACKANPLSKILSILNENGFGVDVASLGELAQAQKSGVRNLIATGPAKSPAYLEKLLDAGVSTIIIESIQQLRDLNEIARKRGIKQDILIRLQLDWTGSVKSVLGGSGVTPFGLHPEDWKEIQFSEYAHLNVLGVHCFQWGNILRPESLQKIWEDTISRCVNFAHDMKINLQVLDLGGGLGVPYSGEESLRFKDVHEVLVSLKRKYEIPEIWLELGRYSIAEFGTYLTKIIDIKSVRGKKLIVTNGGINHLARPALVNEAFPVTALRDGNKSSFSIHGPLCTALDYLGDHELPEDLFSGEWLLFHKTGAYGFTESMPYFLCHEICGEAFIHQGRLNIARDPEAATNWMK